MTVPVGADGVLGLYSAVGDAFAGRRLGFGRRRAALAARFARHRGAGDAGVAASWIAGALAEIGAIGIVLAPDAAAPARLHAFADAPLHGAHLIAAFPGLPSHAADIVRWHREHDDGTGSPDRLRWDGIPADAAALGIVHAFLEAVEDPAEPREPPEAVFALATESGRRFRVELLRAFRGFAAGPSAEWDAPFTPELPALDDEAALAALIARIDARDSATAGRSERLAAAAAALAERVGQSAVEGARLARLLALGRAAEAIAPDDFDPLSRFAREHRTAVAQRAAAIAGSVPQYAADAPYLAGSAGWFEEGAQDPRAAVLALVVAADALRPADAVRRLTAAAGTQLDPEVTRAYLAGLGAPT
jgi:HD-GYP domain-containing protein (c-di-GMP phosphodiesterase class II)